MKRTNDLTDMVQDLARAQRKHGADLQAVKAQICAEGTPSLCERLDRLEAQVGTILLWVKRRFSTRREP